MKTAYLAIGDTGCSSVMVDVPDDDDPDVVSSVLSRPVGQGGANLPDDVIAVQTRLNRVRAELGGPVAPLVIDGKCGLKTVSAIYRFQHRYFRELVQDGRVEPNRNTWKKLLSLSGGPFDIPVSQVPSPQFVGATPVSTLDPAAQTLLNTTLFKAQGRVLASISALDVAASELDGCWAASFMNPSGTMTLFQAYQQQQHKLLELPTVDRCFHVAGPKMDYNNVKESIGRLRKIFVLMMDVIVANSFITDEDEKSGRKRFIRAITQAKLNKDHPNGGAWADAVEAGWHLKNANKAHIRVGTDVLNTYHLEPAIVHELAHFVSSWSTYPVGDHVSGIWNKAFNDTHFQAVRNAFCYEWYAFLALRKEMRVVSNELLPLT